MMFKVLLCIGHAIILKDRERERESAKYNNIGRSGTRCKCTANLDPVNVLQMYCKCRFCKCTANVDPVNVP